MDGRYILYLSGMINHEEYLNESKDNGGTDNYMFFSNLKQIKSQCEEMLAMDKNEVDKMLSDGHNWALDHISTSKDDVEEVYNWLKNRGEKEPKKE